MAAIFISTVLNKLLWDTQGGKSIKGVGENYFLNFPRLRLIATRKNGCKNHNIFPRTRQFKMAAVSLERHFTNALFSCFNFIKENLTGTRIKSYQFDLSDQEIIIYLFTKHRMKTEDSLSAIVWNDSALVYRSSHKFRPMKTVQCRLFFRWYLSY